ncbi:MAG: hypothetical protein ABI462_00480 [Ignavibacteria bacterium]
MQTGKKKILIISVTDQDSDPRVIRQIDFLKDEYDIFGCGISNRALSPEKFYKISINRRSLPVKIVTGSMILMKMFDRAEKYILRSKIKAEFSEDQVPEFDLIIANDLDSIPIAFKKFRSKKVIADLHEYAPEEFEDKLYWKLFHKKYMIHQCSKYFPLLSGATTVCKSIAEVYNKNFGVLPVVITNAANYNDLKPMPVGEKIRIIHHGVAVSSRKIEIMIEAAKMIDNRFTFDLMLIPNEKDYYNKLKVSIAGTKNIKMIEPVSFNEIIPFCNSYDIGLFILPPVNINYKYALPNKFFEFIQSRLAVITGPSVEMKNIIREYELGISTETFETGEIAGKINALTTEQISFYKKNSGKHAMELSSERNKIILNNLVSKILTGQ